MAAPSRLLYGLVQTIVCREASEIESTFQAIETAADSGKWLALAADYELGYELEPALRRQRSTEHPLLTALVFEHMLPLAHNEADEFIAAQITALPPQARVTGIAGLQPSLSETDFNAAIARVRAYIEAGDCYQVNFTYALNFDTYGAPLALYAKLRRAQPVRYGAFVQTPQQAILSLSPELFLERRGERLTSRPMKGTTSRGATPAEDAAQSARLAASAKDQAENLMIVDLVRSDMGRIATPGGVRVERLFEIETYPTLLQMVSTVSAQPHQRALSGIFPALFPCGSVTGAPKIRAMQIIQELENTPRGLYTGALGWLEPGGDFRFNVPIRTLVLDEHKRGKLGIGSGIVYDSDAASEFAECRMKGHFLTALEVNFQLIESLRLESAHPDFFPLIGEHLKRLAASAAYFGFACDTEAVRRQLMAHARTLKAAQACKTRLLLSQNGECNIASLPLETEMDNATVVLSPLSLDSGDLLLRHKTTARAIYDAELARIAAIPGCVDALFCNERGELCEGARNNLFLSIDGALYTPPLSAGLLNGVMRQRILAEGKASERTLYLIDLQRAEAVYLSNAVRGLRRVALAV